MGTEGIPAALPYAHEVDLTGPVAERQGIGKLFRELFVDSLVTTQIERKMQ